MKQICRSARSLRTVQKYPAASNWLVAAGPVWKANHWAPTFRRLNHLICGLRLSGLRQAYFSEASKWSCKFRPTPGRSIATTPKHQLTPGIPVTRDRLRHAVVEERHAARPVATDVDPGNVAVGPDGQVPASPCRFQIGMVPWSPAWLKEPNDARRM